MSKNKRTRRDRQKKHAGDHSVHGSVISKSDPEAPLFEKTEIFLSGHLNGIFWLSFITAAISGILLFDIRFSLSGDDSAYVLRAYNFIHHLIFPGFQGPLYPLILGPFVALFGISAVPLKALSLVFILGFIYFFYRSFRNRIPAILLCSVLLLTSINPFILYYGSQTYSEAFFMMFQAFAFWIFFDFFIGRPADNDRGTTQVKHHLISALCFLGLGLTRSIGFSAVVTAALYFLLRKRWNSFFLFSGSFLAILFAFQTLKFLFLGTTVLHFTNDIQSLAFKDYYNPVFGYESLAGFGGRLAFNTNYYLSQSLPVILGFRDAGNAVDLYPVVAISIGLLLVSACILVARKNEFLFLTSLYTLITLFIIFFISHTIWQQSRFIIPYIPMILLSLLAFFYFLLIGRKRRKLQFILPFILITLMVAGLRICFTGITEARRIDGIYYGLTPDWENYCRLSAWIPGNLPENAVVACRKPSISFIYSHGRNFFGITRLPFSPFDSLAKNWDRKRVHYYLIPVMSLKNVAVSDHLYHVFKQSISGIGMNLNNNYYNVRFEVMNFPDSSREETLKELKNLNIKVSDRLDSLRSWIEEPFSELSMIYPDSLLKTLHNAKVTYVMSDNIRYIPEEKNSKFITLTEKYMNFIEARYPHIRTKVMQTGLDENEPASVYRIDYEQAGLSVP